MRLFVFREVADKNTRLFFRHTRIRPSIYALHPTKETITEEEWKDITKEAEARYQKDREWYSKAAGRIFQEIKEKDLQLSSSECEKYFDQRLNELGIISFGMVHSLVEVLTEKGFEIIVPAGELTFHYPLNEEEAKILAEYGHLVCGIPYLDRIKVSEALGTLELFCGIDSSELASLIFEQLFETS